MKDSKKSKQISDFNQFMDSTFEGIKKTDPEFGKALIKWKRLFFSTVIKVAHTTESSLSDVYHELMVPLVKINSVHKLQLYRYNKKVYELDKLDGPYARLKPLKYNIRKSHVVWTPVETIEPIKQAQLSALVYKKIQQQASVMVRSAFTKKKGYEVVSENTGYVKMRNAAYGVKFKPILRKNVARVTSEVSLDSDFLPGHSGSGGLSRQDTLADPNGFEAEEEYSVKEIQEKLSDRLSWPAKALLELNLDSPNLCDNQILKSLNFTRRRLESARCEIIRHYNDLTGNRFKSTYAPNAIYKGMHYYILDQDEEYIIIKAGKYVRSVPRSEVRIETELAYRTPIHLPSSLVS